MQIDVLSAKIRKLMVSAIADYHLIESGDKILVAVSGGKDSSILVMLLEEIRKKAPYPFTIEAVLLDQKQPGFSADRYRHWIESLGISFTMIEEDTFSIVKEKIPEGQTYCSLCSRLRRGILYTYASKHRFTKIALGHHRDDINETVLMNLFYSGRLAGMPPKLKSEDGRNVVIRPLCYVPEQYLRELSQLLQIPVIPCNLCGSQEGLIRTQMKQLLQSLEAQNENVGNNILAALQHIQPSQLMDQKLWDFEQFQLQIPEDKSTFVKD